MNDKNSVKKNTNGGYHRRGGRHHYHHDRRGDAAVGSGAWQGRKGNFGQGGIQRRKVSLEEFRNARKGKSVESEGLGMHSRLKLAALATIVALFAVMAFSLGRSAWVAGDGGAVRSCDVGTASFTCERCGHVNPAPMEIR